MSSIDNMVGLTLEDSKSEVDYVLMLSNSARKVKLVHEKIDSRKPLKILTSQTRTFEILQEDGLDVTFQMRTWRKRTRCVKSYSRSHLRYPIVT